MTSRQIMRLESIVGKLEALQGQVADSSIRDRLSVAKSELLRALSEALK